MTGTSIDPPIKMENLAIGLEKWTEAGIYDVIKEDVRLCRLMCCLQSTQDEYERLFTSLCLPYVFCYSAQ